MRLYRAIIYFLLPTWVGVLFGAQTFTIPQGTTVYGPISASVGKKYAYMEIDRSLWTDPKVTLDATVEYSTNKGSTWVFFCRFGSKGSKLGKPLTIMSCPGLPDNATNIQATTVVAGGNIVMPKPPTFENR